MWEHSDEAHKVLNWNDIAYRQTLMIVRDHQCLHPHIVYKMSILPVTQDTSRLQMTRQTNNSRPLQKSMILNGTHKFSNGEKITTPSTSHTDRASNLPTTRLALEGIAATSDLRYGSLQKRPPGWEQYKLPSREDTSPAHSLPILSRSHISTNAIIGHMDSV